MKTALFVATCLLVCLVLQTVSKADIQVVDPGYKAEVWLNLTSTYVGEVRDMTFDASNNLYLTTRWGGTITKVTPEKQANRNWATGLDNPIGIAYTGGSTYGNNLYVSCIGNGKVVKIDMNGNKTDFSSLGGVESIGFDNTGQYGSKLYVGTSGGDRIYSLSTTGASTVFSNSFYDLHGSIQEITFANSADYGYGMYAGTWYPNNLTKSGVFKVSTTGATQRTCNELTGLVSGFCMDFDDVGLFGDNLFARITVNGGADGGIYRILPDGSASLFITGSLTTLLPFTFGQDGAMYLYDWTANSSAIYKITPVPEPGTILILGAGLLCLRRRK